MQRRSGHHLDLHLADDHAPLPRAPRDAGRPHKRGQSKACWVWPRDKTTIHGTPPGSWRRWKDLLLGKGPGIWLAHREQYSPTRADWSDWAHPAQVYDSLEYGNEHHHQHHHHHHHRVRLGMERAGGDGERRHHVNRRRYTRDWLRPEVWGDAQWDVRRRFPPHRRDGHGCEWTARNGYVLPFDNGEFGNDFRYRPYTTQMDWMRPEPTAYYQRAGRG